MFPFVLPGWVDWLCCLVVCIVALWWVLVGLLVCWWVVVFCLVGFSCYGVLLVVACWNVFMFCLVGVFNSVV